MSDIALPKVERRELPLLPAARAAVLEAQAQMNLAKAHMDSLLTGIVVAAGISRGTVIEVGEAVLVVDVSLNGNGHGHTD